MRQMSGEMANCDSKKTTITSIKRLPKGTSAHQIPFDGVMLGSRLPSVGENPSKEKHKNKASRGAYDIVTSSLIVICKLAILALI